MANDPIVFYSFDETSGSVAHDQQDGHDGTIYGATHVPGVTGNALQFNGSSDYVSVPDSPDWNFGSGDFTLEFWANFNSIPSGSAGQPGDVLIGQDEGGGGTNKWFFEAFDGSIGFHVNTVDSGYFFIDAPFEPITGQWYSFDLVKSGSSYQFYVDGQLVGTADESLVLPDVNAPLTIGHAEAFGFDGLLDGVAIYNGALSQAEVQQSYQDGAGVPGGGPVITSNGGGSHAFITTPENTTAVTTVTATDPDAGNTPTYSISGGFDGNLFSIDSQTGALTFTTAPDYEHPNLNGGGFDEFYDVQVRATDAGGLFSDQLITVTVADANETPTITSNGGGDRASVTVPENTKTVTTVTATDSDAGDTPTYSISGGFDGNLFSIDSQTGALTFTTVPDYEHPNLNGGGFDEFYDVQVRATDAGGLFSDQLITVTVADANETPTITSNGGGDRASVTVPENTKTVTTVTATDPDAGNTPTYSISGGFDGNLFSIDSQTGALTFTTAPDYEHPNLNGGGFDEFYDVQVRATDAGGLFSDQLITVNVTNVNEVPTITSNGGGNTAAVNVAENSTAVTTVAASDPDAATTLSYSIIGGADAAKFAIDIATGALAFRTAPDFETPIDAGANNVYDVSVGTSDGNGGTDTQAIAVTVQNVAGATINGTAGNDAIDATHTVAGQPLPTNEEDTINAGGGKDTINALGGNDFINGGAGADTMAGGVGNDTYVVDNTADVLTENSGGGVDTVLSSVDFILGQNFEWLTLTGSGKIDGTGNNLDNNISGNSNNNVLSGGLGADGLTGGAGADIFKFSTLADSTPTSVDIVQDFSHGTDKIDIADIDANATRNGNQAFAFAGQNSGVVANSVTWYESGGNTFVQADVNGNTTADVLIELAGTNLHLSASDFLL